MVEFIDDKINGEPGNTAPENKTSTSPDYIGQMMRSGKIIYESLEHLEQMGNKTVPAQASKTSDGRILIYKGF
jgi:hypothetical protein